MEIIWKESNPKWDGAKVFSLEIKGKDMKLKGSLYECLGFSKELTGYRFSCSALIIKDEVVANQEIFEREGFKLRVEKLKYAKEQAINLLIRKLIGRKDFYSKVINEDIIEIKKDSRYSGYFKISLPDGKRIINGIIRIEDGIGKLQLPWLNLSKKIAFTTEDGMKEEVFGIIKDILEKRISLANELEEKNKEE